VAPCPRPSNQAVQRTPLARFLGWARFMLPSGAANRHVRRLPRAAGGSAANGGQPIRPTRVACPLGWRPVGARPGVARRMTARWSTARRARWDDGPSCPARWRVRESRAGRVPINGVAGQGVPCPRVLTTAGRTGESRARESGTTAGRAGRMGAVRSCPRPSNQAVQRTPLARFLGWARFMCPAAPLTATLGGYPAQEVGERRRACAGLTRRTWRARLDDGSLCPARCGPADDGPLERGPLWPAGMTARSARPVGDRRVPCGARPAQRRGGPASPISGESRTTAGRARESRARASWSTAWRAGRMTCVLPCPRPSNQAVQRTPLARLVGWARFMHLPRAVVCRAPHACQRRR